MRLILLFATIILLGMGNITAAAQNDLIPDAESKRLVNEMRKHFNTPNEEEFYKVAREFSQYSFKKGNMRNYYRGMSNEILYDINHNHFYKAMKKARNMSEDMRKRKCEDEYYSATYLIGIIYSLRGNLPLAKQYFEQALSEVDNQNPRNAVSIYTDLANIEMEKEPYEALKHIDTAMGIIQEFGQTYEYTDALALKMLVYFGMRDWKNVRKCYHEYMQLKDKGGMDDISSTYFNYIMIGYLTSNRQYLRAIQWTKKLTNTTDMYKMQAEVYEISGNTRKALTAHKQYMEARDSINNIILGEELVGAANDLELVKIKNQADKAQSMETIFILTTLIAVLIIAALIYIIKNRRDYTKQLKKKNRELEIANDKAMESERLKSSFLSNMSHEIRTPLNIISGFAQIVTDPNYVATPEERKSIANRITSSSELIIRIINEILDLSNKECVHYITRNDIVACNEICYTMISKYTGKQKPGVSLECKCAINDNFTFKTNHEQLLKLLDCLINNAIKFTDKGSITLATTIHKENNTIVFSVTDTGCGIKKSEQERIFDQFYKIDTYKEGVGLGLPLARKIAQQLDGDVTLDKTYTQGARFNIILPFD